MFLAEQLLITNALNGLQTYGGRLPGSGMGAKTH